MLENGLTVIAACRSTTLVNKNARVNGPTLPGLVTRVGELPHIGMSRRPVRHRIDERCSGQARYIDVDTINTGGGQYLSVCTSSNTRPTHDEYLGDRDVVKPQQVHTPRGVSARRRGAQHRRSSWSGGTIGVLVGPTLQRRVLVVRCLRTARCSRCSRGWFSSPTVSFSVAVLMSAGRSRRIDDAHLGAPACLPRT